MKKIAYVISIIYAIFISIFAFDEIGHSIIGFLIHLIPALLVVVVILIARKYKYPGAILFGILAIATIVFFKTYQDVVVFIIISLPPIVVSILLIGDLMHNSSQHRT